MQIYFRDQKNISHVYLARLNIFVVVYETVVKKVIGIWR